MKDFNVSHFDEQGRSPITPSHGLAGRWLTSLLRGITTTPADEIEGHAGTVPDAVPAHAVEERWGRHLSVQTVQRLQEADVLVCGAFDDSARSNLREIGAYGRSYRVFGTHQDVARHIHRAPSARQLVICQVRDTIGSLERLAEFRSRFPQAAVILVSPEFARNDFSGERRVVCDASIRSADARASLAMAVTVALQNHDEYLMRGIF